MNQWLDIAPHATIAHGTIASRVSLDDMADRAPRTLADGEILDIGGKRLRYLDTPHVPHGWEAGILFEETTATLLCGDLFTHPGNGPAITSGDVVGPAMAAETLFGYSSLTPTTGPTIRRLAGLEPSTLAVMHGSSYTGDCGQALRDLADRYDERVRAMMG
jgi:flavorubredoxin